MIGDILTVLWREGLELLHLRGSARSTLMMLLIPVAILGIMFPLQFGRQWVSSPIFLIMWAWFPLIFTITVISDSVAGEKERHTLETLLASRLPDRAILFGKLLASVLYALATTALIILIGLVTVNIRYAGEGIIWFNGVYFLAGASLGVLGTTFISTVGILVSLKAQTVRQAAQTMSFGIIIVAVLPGLLIGILPVHLRKWIFSSLDNLDGALALIAVIGVFLVINALLLAVTLSRFKRNRLMTE